ncbi:hypothetical protein [Novipirellula artificiosorum]|uniref:hypothetical protein n=1 Tax=Novipirellula artificiosorum TaxID=2528016 RepID=UPI0011B5CA06|nr:hypothetical protein [Novipirellula artificiosorum]
MCRILCAAALLLHSFFGCGMVFCLACEHELHAHLASEHATIGDCCHTASLDACRHVHETDDKVGFDPPRLLGPRCCVCEQGPCDRQPNDCHNQVNRCFLVRSQWNAKPAAVVIPTAALTADVCLQDLHRRSAKGQRRGEATGVSAPVSLCALYCTWRL